MKLDVAVNSVQNYAVRKSETHRCPAAHARKRWEIHSLHGIEKCAHTKLSGKDIMPMSTT